MADIIKKMHGFADIIHERGIAYGLVANGIAHCTAVPNPFHNKERWPEPTEQLESIAYIAYQSIQFTSEEAAQHLSPENRHVILCVEKVMRAHDFLPFILNAIQKADKSTATIGMGCLCHEPKCLDRQFRLGAIEVFEDILRQVCDETSEESKQVLGNELLMHRGIGL